MDQKNETTGATAPSQQTTEQRPPLAAATPGKLKPPTKIASLSVKRVVLPALSKNDGAENVAPSADAGAGTKKQEEPKDPKDEFPVYPITSLKRKPEPSATTRNTRARLDNASNSTASTRTTTARSNISARTTTTRAAAAKSTTTARSTIGTRTTTTRAAPRTVGAAKTAAPSTKAAPKAAAPKAESEEGGATAVPKKKRPAWDVKGRLQDLEDHHQTTQAQLQDSRSMISTMTDELSRSRSTIDELIKFRESLQNQVVVKEQENHTYAQQIRDLKDELQSDKRRHEDELHTLKSRHSREIDDVQRELDSLKRTHEGICNELKSAKEENVTLRSTISSQSALSVSMEAEMRANKLKLEQTEGVVRERGETIDSLKAQLEKAEETVKMLESKVREEESIRRRLHNTIQELKGNIRVFCRVRPPLANEVEEKKDDILTHISFADNDEKAIELKQSVDSASGQKSVEKAYPFSFDRVFQPATKQTEVFEEISQLVQSALDGYNVCIFAYGQTGSGKTFTMEGPPNVLENPDDMGMIPRAVLQIFDTAQALREKGWAYEMEAQFLEIYNESIRDLIGGGKEDVKHDIKHNPSSGKTSVTDIVTVQVTTPQEVHNVLKKASHNRAVAATNCNERSSRSHSVFTLRLSGTNSLTGETSAGILNLIDLAGSERLSASGSTGDRLKETQAINKSLSCLGDVIYALANGEKHVPYRNSKLTYLLQGSLGGNSKTLMFVNFSPLASNFQETLCSLRFATKVNSCQIGTAKKLVK